MAYQPGRRDACPTLDRRDACPTLDRRDACPTLGWRGAALRVLGFLLLLAAFTTGALVLQHKQLQRIAAERPYLDSLFLPRKEVAKILSFGYDGFMADFLFLRSVQAFGGQWNKAIQNYGGVADYFETIAELDPRFMDTYEFGSMVMSENAADPQRAIELNKIGWLNNRKMYKPCYLNAYISWYVMKQKNPTKLWVRLAQKAPDCPEFVGRLEIYVDVESGEFRAGLDRWIDFYLNAAVTRDSSNRNLWETHFPDIAEKWNLDILYRALGKYRDEHQGRIPMQLEELDQQGYLKDYDACDYPTMMQLLEAVWDAGSLRKEDVGRMLKSITQQVYVKKSGVPLSPYSNAAPGGNWYLIRKDLGPEESLDEGFKNRRLILSWKSASEWTSGALGFIRSHVEKFNLEKKRYPASLEELPPEVRKAVDPIAGKWDYDPKTGKVKSPTFPEL
jgi:hypothetical protein